MKKSLTIIGIILSTTLLAILSVATAIRIRNLGTQPVSPNAPSSKPAAQETVPPEDAVPEVGACKKTFTVAEQPKALGCKEKRAYRDDSRNKAGTYYLDKLIPNGGTVSKGEKIVFYVVPESLGIGETVTVTDVLPTSVKYLDGDKSCTYKASNRTVTCQRLNRSVAFRVEVEDDAEGTITNTAKVQGENGLESSCSISLTVKPPQDLGCIAKKAYKDDSRNRAGNYYLENEIKNNGEVKKGEVVVFSVDVMDAKTQTITDILPEGVDLIDYDKNCTYTAATRTLVCELTDDLIEEEKIRIAFRAKITKDPETTLTNTAKVQVEGTSSTCSIALKVATEPPGPTSTPGPGSYCDYLQANKAGGPSPLTVKFSGKGYDPTRVKGFRFHFGDGEKREFFGSFSSSQVQEVEYTYQSKGKYEAYLEIMDDGDHWKTRPECEVTITVDGGTTPAPSVTKTITKVSPTEMELPEAGIKIPTLGGIIIGFFLISLGAALVF
jgi:hypothetical protein